MSKTIWTQGTLGVETTIEDFRVSRSTLNNGGHFYYVHWFECPHYAAHHSRMSSPFRSLASARKFIQFLNSEPLKYFSLPRLLRVKASLAKLDAKYPRFDEQWCRLRSRYTRIFRLDERVGA